jgi:putative phage-type endonuclease
MSAPVERRPISSRIEWLQWRQSLLCASEIGAVVGVDPFRTGLGVYSEKAGLLPAQPDAPILRRGRWLEHAAIAALREEQADWRIVQPNVFLIDGENRLGATPDALTEDESGELVNIQIKSTSPAAFERWDGHPPVAYQLQVAAENMLLDAARGLLVVFVVEPYSARLEYFDVPRHAPAEARIRALATEFWSNIAAGRRPAPDYTADGETIRTLYPPRADVPAPLDLTTDNRIGTLLEERERLKETIKTATEDCEALDAELIDKLAGAERAIADGWRVSYRMQHRNEYTVAAKDFPALRVTKTKEAA